MSDKFGLNCVSAVLSSPRLQRAWVEAPGIHGKRHDWANSVSWVGKWRQRFILIANSLYCCSVFTLGVVRFCLTGDKFEKLVPTSTMKTCFQGSGKESLALEGEMRPKIGTGPTAVTKTGGGVPFWRTAVGLAAAFAQWVLFACLFCPGEPSRVCYWAAHGSAKKAPLCPSSRILSLLATPFLLPQNHLGLLSYLTSFPCFLPQPPSTCLSFPELVSRVFLYDDYKTLASNLQG